MSVYEIAISMALATFGAWINAVAGGGTFLTFPLLTFLGLGALQANIVSTVALWPGAVASTIAYRALWRPLIKQLPAFIIVSFVGSAVGAWLLLHFPEQSFERLVPWLLLFAALLLSFGNHLKSWLKPGDHSAPGNAVHISKKQWYIMLACQCIISIYGGYFGAGIGILMLAVLQFAPLQNIHEMNAVKVVLGSAINAVAFLMFVLSGRVDWNIGFWMLIGGIIGGYVGTRISLNISPIIMRKIILIIAWIMTAGYMAAYFYTSH